MNKIFLLYRAVLRNLFLLLQLGTSFPRVPWESSICSSPHPVNCRDPKNEFCAACLTDIQKDIAAQISSEFQNRNFFQMVSPWLDTQSRPSKISDETELATFQRRYLQAQCLMHSEWCQL